MKKFLKDLEKELKNLKFSEEEIKEILADHEEMIEQAMNEGLTEEEISEKFGNPTLLASDLHRDQELNEDVFLNHDAEMIEGFNLFKSVAVSEKLTKALIKVVSEDTKIYTHDKQVIDIYFKKVQDPKIYDISVQKGVFKFFRKTTTSGLFSFRRSEGEIIIKIPTNTDLDEYSFTSVSGDLEVLNAIAQNVVIKTTSGDVEISTIQANKAELTTVSGDMEIAKLKSKSLFLSSVSGDFEMKDIEVDSDVKMNTVSGDYEVLNLTANTVDFKTVSGDLEASEFYVNTVDLKSVSGDIDIINEDKSRPINVGKKRTLSGDINIK